MLPWTVFVYKIPCVASLLRPVLQRATVLNGCTLMNLSQAHCCYAPLSSSLDKTSFTSCTRTVHNGVGHFFIQLKNNVVLAKVKIRTFDNIKQRYAGCYVFRLCLHQSSSAVTDRMTSDGAEACYDAVASRTCAHFADYVFISWCCDRCPGWSSIMVPASLHLFCYLYVLFRTF